MPRRNDSKSATNPDQPQQPDNVAVNDRIAARGADYAYDNNASAEGNDAALIAGPAFVRKVNPDGTVQAVPVAPERETEAGTAEAGDAADDGDTTQKD